MKGTHRERLLTVNFHLNWCSRRDTVNMIKEDKIKIRAKVNSIGATKETAQSIGIFRPPS